jgi:hypothetical protein
VFGNFALAIIPPGVPVPERFAFDAVNRQTHTRRLTVIRHPVEEGLAVSDHARREPDVIQLDGIVSDTPISEGSIPGGAASGALGNLLNRAHRELLKLNEHFEKREPVFLATSLRVYENAVIEQFSFSKSAGVGNAIEISISLVEVRIVSQLEVPPVSDLDGLFFGAEGTVDLGTQGTI